MISGLGDVSLETFVSFDRSDPSESCTHWSLNGSFVSAKDGTLLVVGRTSGCQEFASATVPVMFTGSGGPLTGATGTGALAYRSPTPETAGVGGTSPLRLTITLQATGVTFDTDPPVISAAPIKVVKTRKRHGAVVRFKVSATDTVDGPVAVACTPPSGSRFPIGKTRVICTATDTSGNTATKSLIVTVRLKHR